MSNLRTRLDRIDQALGPKDRTPAVATLASLPGSPTFSRLRLWVWTKDNPGHPLGAVYMYTLDEVEPFTGGLPDVRWGKNYQRPADAYCEACEAAVREADALLAKGVPAAEVLRRLCPRDPEFLAMLEA